MQKTTKKRSDKRREKRQVEALNAHRHLTLKNHVQNPYFNSKGERQLKKVIEQKFPQYKWQTGGGFKLTDNIVKSLDIYCRELKLIIEYDGVYHFREVFGNFEEVVKKDEALELFCENHGWKLIRVNEATYKNYEEILTMLFGLINNVSSIPIITKLYFFQEDRCNINLVDPTSVICFLQAEEPPKKRGFFC